MEKPNPVEIEKELVSRLSSANLNKEHLANLSKSIAGTRMMLLDWHIVGTPPIEQVVFQGQIAVKDVSALQSLFDNERIREITILRKGIPIPDIFHVNFSINKH